MKNKEYYFKICPECNSCNLDHDHVHKEVYCKKCGLVIIAPPTLNITTDGYKFIHITANFNDINVITETTRNITTS